MLAAREARGGHPRGGHPPAGLLQDWLQGWPRRQKGLPSAISQYAISKATNIYRARTTPLHLEQIEAHFGITSAQN